MERTMNKALVTVATVIALGIASLPAHAQGYTVNGRDASAGEAQLLRAFGAGPGDWSISGLGIVSSSSGQNTKAGAGLSDHNHCWYVLDVKLCD
jgi:hypothetical protein